jgi:hypothetical protein
MQNESKELSVAKVVNIIFILKIEKENLNKLKNI